MGILSGSGNPEAKGRRLRRQKAVRHGTLLKTVTGMAMENMPYMSTLMEGMLIEVLMEILPSINESSPRAQLIPDD